MKQSITRKNVALRAGVSTTTVSYVMNRRTDVSIPECTRTKVLRAAAELGYQPNFTAKALRTGKTNLIALFTPNLKISFFGEIINQVTMQMELHNYQMLHFEDTGLLSNDELNQTWLSTGMVDGIFVYDGMFWFPKFLKHRKNTNIPVVGMGSYNPEGIDLVTVDFIPAFNNAIKHLINSGCKKVMYALNAWTNNKKDVRRNAYAKIMKEYGLPTIYLDIDNKPTIMRNNARNVIVEYAKSNSLPDGIICMNDDIAIGIYRGIKDMGLSIPQDVLLIGCDGIEDTEYMDSPISTIIVPTRQMSIIACDYMCQRFENPSLPLQRTIVQPQFEPRQSSFR